MASYLIRQDLIKKAAGERGAVKFQPGVRKPVAFVYPNLYRVGMSNLGLQILYKILNDRGDVACERYFLPERDLIREHQRSHTPLLSVENQRQLANNDIIFVMLSFEMDYDNLLTILDLGNIKLRAAARNEKEPLIIIGGPCATFNPLPLGTVADAFVIGEGEEIVSEIIEADKGDRATVYERLAQIPGVFVPGARTKEQGARIERRWKQDLEAFPHTSAILAKDTEFSNMHIVEVARGCGRHCRFCMAGYCFRKPRPRPLENIIRDIENRPEGTEKIGLMGAAVSDHPQIKEIVNYLREHQIKFSVASLRADTLSEEMCGALAASGQHTLTVAPEAGSVKMRGSINKGITEEHVFRALELGTQAGIENFKLYFMIGLPGENVEDVKAIIDLVLRIRRQMDEVNNRGDLIISVNAFVPKPFTPYQWCGLEKTMTLRHRFKMLKDAFAKEKKIKLLTESLKETLVQAYLAKGDAQAGEYLLASHEQDKPLKYLLQEHNINIEEICTRTLAVDETLPWDFLDMGFSKNYLKSEWEKSQCQEFTQPCFDGCMRCGNCKL